jgi:hypothetical protein
MSCDYIVTNDTGLKGEMFFTGSICIQVKESEKDDSANPHGHLDLSFRGTFSEPNIQFIMIFASQITNPFPDLSSNLSFLCNST